MSGAVAGFHALSISGGYGEVPLEVLAGLVANMPPTSDLLGLCINSSLPTIVAGQGSRPSRSGSTGGSLALLSAGGARHHPNALLASCTAARGAPSLRWRGGINHGGGIRWRDRRALLARVARAAPSLSSARAMR